MNLGIRAMFRRLLQVLRKSTLLRYAVFLTDPLVFLGIAQSLCTVIAEKSEPSTLRSVTNAKDGPSIDDPGPQIRVLMLFDTDGIS